MSTGIKDKFYTMKIKIKINTNFYFDNRYSQTYIHSNTLLSLSRMFSVDLLLTSSHNKILEKILINI